MRLVSWNFRQCRRQSSRSGVTETLALILPVPLTVQPQANDFLSLPSPSMLCQYRLAALLGENSITLFFYGALNNVMLIKTARRATLSTFYFPQGMYVFLHAVKGTPFETPDQGKARLLTHWEQLDYGVQFTSSRKFFTISPIILWVRNSVVDWVIKP